MMCIVFESKLQFELADVMFFIPFWRERSVPKNQYRPVLCTTMLYCINTCILFFPIPHATFQCLTINITIYCAFGNRYWVYIGWVSEMHVAQLLLCILVRLTDGQRAKMKFITNHLFTLKNGFRASDQCVRVLNAHHFDRWAFLNVIFVNDDDICECVVNSFDFQ